MTYPCPASKMTRQSAAKHSEEPPRALRTHLLAPGHTVSEVVDKVLTVPLNQAILHYLVDHVLRALDDLVHGEGQVCPVQLVVDLPGAAMQHVLQPAVLHHGAVAEDRSDAAHLKLLTWGARAKVEDPRERGGRIRWI